MSVSTFFKPFSSISNGSKFPHCTVDTSDVMSILVTSTAKAKKENIKKVETSLLFAKVSITLYAGRVNSDCEPLDSIAVSAFVVILVHFDKL